MQRQRVSADYLQTSAVIEPDGTVRSAVSDPNRYEGPGTGYRLEGERWELLQQLPYVLDPREEAIVRMEASSSVQSNTRCHARRQRRTRS